MDLDVFQWCFFVRFASRDLIWILSSFKKFQCTLSLSLNLVITHNTFERKYPKAS